MKATVLLNEAGDGVLAQAAHREDIVRCADQIPVLPLAVLKVLELLDDPGSDAGELAEAVSLDTRLTTALLKLAHSGAYPATEGVLSVTQAVTTVGLSQLRVLVLTTSLIGLAKREAVDKLVWENSLATAIIARRLAGEVAHTHPDEVFLLGLLHCLGQFIFLAHPKTRLAYSRVLRRIQESGVDYITAELAELGFAHNAIGALAANRWNFPAEVCQTILHYPEPLEPLVTRAGQTQALIKLADLLAHAAFIGHPPGYPVQLDLIEQLADTVKLLPERGRSAVELIVTARNQIDAAADLWSAFASG